MNILLDKILQWDDELHTYSYNWEIIESIPEFNILKECKQNPKWHGEGTAWQHTVNVCNAMRDIVIKQNIYNCISGLPVYTDENVKYNAVRYRIKVLLTAVLFHDIGKGVTTFEKSGVYHAYSHEFEGERITRYLLWDEPIEFRETVCSLIRYHMEVLRIFDHKDIFLHILKMSKCVNMQLLLCVKYADCLGSTPEDITITNNNILQLNTLHDICINLNCLYTPSYCITNNKYPWKVSNNGKQNINVCILIGLPGAGKDTYINNIILSDKNTIIFDQWNPDNTVIISRDSIRENLGLCNIGEKIIGSSEQENIVTETFNKLLCQAANDGKNIIINNINLRKVYRESYKEQLRKYNINFIYVYIQNCSLSEVQDRRKEFIQSSAYKNMILKLDWPQADEYDNFLIQK